MSIREVDVKNLRKQDYVLLVTRRSLALEARYKPKTLHEFANHMVQETAGGYLEISDVLEDLCDAYEKLGFMFYAKKNVEEIDPKTSYYGLVVQYHLLNFIFHCKAFLDSISNAIHHAFDLDIKKEVNIDITRLEFKTKLAQKNPHLADNVTPFLEWAKYIADYRVALIHRYRIFGLVKDPTLPKFEILREPIRPLRFFDQKQLDAFANELKMKYGSSMVRVDVFCKEALDNARGIFEMIISEFLKEIRSKGPNVFGWERIQPSHVGEVIETRKA